MKRNTLNFWVNLVSFLVLWGMIITGIIIAEILPPRSGHYGMNIWGQDRHDIGVIHKYLSYSFIGLMVVHVWLHWTWVCATFHQLFRFSEKSRRNGVYGIGFLLIFTLLTIGILTGADSIVKEGGNVNAHENDQQGEHTMQEYDEYNAEHSQEEALRKESEHITGRHTLREAAQVAGMSAEELKMKLGLPVNVDPDERLGRLKQQYGFEIHDVREIVFLNQNQ